MSENKQTEQRHPVEAHGTNDDPEDVTKSMGETVPQGKTFDLGEEDAISITEKPRSERASSFYETSIMDREIPGNRLMHTEKSTPAPYDAQHLSLADVQQVDVQIRDLRVSVNTSPSIWDPSTYMDLAKETFARNKSQDSNHIKTLLQSVSASLAPGTLTAIIGGSGSGKTTMLNTLAQRVSSSRLSVGGSVAFRDISGGQGLDGPGGDIQSVRYAYVMQQDILLPTLTVRETLRYSADLRLPPSTTTEERMRVVEQVILELGLKECADTRIGDHAHKGCSGGEKRRVSIGVQLLSNPSVLFLDEPTTGLDSTSAFQLVRTLKTLAEKGRTIITTIHQPRAEIWELFDNLVVLTKGSPVFSGPANECASWFADLGYELPPFVNPCEFFIDVSAVDNRTPEIEEETTTRVANLKAAWNRESSRRYPPASAGTQVTSRRAKSEARKHASFLRQVHVLSDRTFKVTYRDPMGMAASIVEAILMGLCTGYLFYDLGRDQSGIRSRQGALYISAGLQGYLFLLFEAYRLSLDIPTFDREHNEGCVDVIPFLLSRRLSRLPTEDFPVPFIFSAIFYFMAGFEREAHKFLIFFAVNFLNHYIAVTCAMVCISAIRHFPGASLLANLNYTLQSMACGFFIQSNTIPVYVRWLKWITYTFYVFGSLCGNEFEGNFYDCPTSNNQNDPSCRPYTGAFIMNALGFPKNWVWKPIVAQVAFVVFFYTAAGFGLRFLKTEMTIARSRTSETDLSFGKEKMNARSIAEVRAIDVGLDDFTLNLEKRSALGKKLPTKVILNPVTTTFRSGQINVIMGPSGSGKTSLLNAMALRLRNTIGTKYRRSGKISFNGAEPSDAVIRSCCSYVSQDDDALLPSLTVRETLRFSAGLRLPSWMSKEEKYKRAEEVLLKMGLKDCADNLVGNDLIKGISGGEKRRVTIAIQILTDPRVLLLDEPTSGLDAFTTLSLMELFAGLASEGRTLILTIHQARSDLFQQFGNVLLLARGGSPVYSGPAGQMVEYFARHGYRCPVNNNPADYALDLITIDLQHADREAASREKVQRLVEGWKTFAEEQTRRGLEQENKETSSGGGTASGVLAPYPTRLSDIREAEEPKSPSESVAPASVAQSIARPDPALFSAASRRSFHKSKLATPAELGAMVRKRASFFTASPILMHRAFVNFRRQPPLLVARMMQVLGLGIILTLFFAPLKSDYYSVQNRAGFIQEIAAFYFIGMLQNVAVYPAERNCFYAEDDDGVYSVEAFLTTYTLLELPFEIVSCMLFGVLAVFAVGLPHTAAMYFVCTFVCFGIVSCGESLGMMFNTLFSNHTGFAITLTSVFLSISNAMGGIMSIDMPAIFNAFNYISPVRFAVLALAPYTLRGVRFSCDASQSLPNGQCIISTGEDVLNLYKLNVNGTLNLGLLMALAFAYRVVAWALLRAVRTKWK
ncbi:hypothetical protein MCOR25_007533 [Pyricularia grisea]|nr:hypothetical protein MCOR25_007533 [Pyricularia grisea]